MNINIPNLLLLPSNIDSNMVKFNLDSLLEASFVFKQLYELETAVKPIISAIETNGITIDSKWLNNEIKRINQQFNVSLGLDALITILNEEKHQGNTRAGKIKLYLLLWVKPFVSSLVNQAGSFTIKGEWHLYSSYSGRMTAKKMPLTSIPKSMRKYAISSSTYKELWSIDLNQAELRFLSYYSNDQFLLNHFSTDQDMYSYIGRLITPYNRNEQPERLRNICKTFFLAWLYGASTNTLLKKLRKNDFDITSVDVNHILEQLELTMPQAVHYLDLCSSQNEVQTFFGRVMPLVKMKESTKLNFALQSSVATAIKLLMLEAYKLDLDIVHVIHDELWIEVNPSYSNWQELLQLNFEKTINRYHNGFPLNNILKFNQLKGEK
ncbi:DNA polymerase [Staphylococcus haemolyticus]|uniref:DNA polymerase n=1 Tax=Staphylococcus haemolyticus TaxID=1283 RepID=UPI001F0A3B00|nr:DNA polymerase [Staphylococcus haemolyticus]MCH4382763.1 DNA polymerase [Staphylococcus haemolyticus]MCH4457700.1 DNA polymerase [Staphylococcus haemolyticus]MCH4491035.1 DNA polymerase [Staphylococcus haemolyticus]